MKGSRKNCECESLSIIILYLWCFLMSLLMQSEARLAESDRRVDELVQKQSKRWDEFCKMADSMKNLSSDMLSQGQANKAINRSQGGGWGIEFHIYISFQCYGLNIVKEVKYAKTLTKLSVCFIHLTKQETNVSKLKIRNDSLTTFNKY